MRMRLFGMCTYLQIIKLPSLLSFSLCHSLFFLSGCIVHNPLHVFNARKYRKLTLLHFNSTMLVWSRAEVPKTPSFTWRLETNAQDFAPKSRARFVIDDLKRDFGRISTFASRFFVPEIIKFSPAKYYRVSRPAQRFGVSHRNCHTQDYSILYKITCVYGNKKRMLSPACVNTKMSYPK